MAAAPLSTQAAGLTASDGAGNDHFGVSLNQFGSIGLVGANLDNVGASAHQGSIDAFRTLGAATGSVSLL